MPFAVRLLVATAVVLGGYAAVLQMWQPTVTVGQSQGATNVIAVENYLMQAAPPPVLLVGSSMAKRLPAERLGSGIYNMALAGDSALTGLAVAARMPAPPPLVLIEANVLSRSVNQELVETVFAWPRAELRRHVAAARLSYRPGNLLTATLARLKPPAQEAATPPAVKARLIEAAVKRYGDTADMNAINANIASLQALVDGLTARGSKVAFMRMPMDRVLVDHPANLLPREAMAQAFPAERFCWLDLPEVAETTDGVHVTRPEAERLAASLKLTTESGLSCRPVQGRSNG